MQHAKAWELTRIPSRGSSHAMATHQQASFIHPRFTPSEVERVTGLSPVAVRDWRRRGLIHPTLDKSEDGRFHMLSVAELLLLKRLSDHGIGPKQVYGWASSYSKHLFHHALNDSSAWTTGEAWEEWQRYRAHGEKVEGSLKRFWVIRTAPGGFEMTDDPFRALRGSNGVGTIVDFEALGSELRTACSASSIAWRTFDFDDDVAFGPGSDWQPVAAPRSGGWVADLDTGELVSGANEGTPTE